MKHEYNKKIGKAVLVLGMLFLLALLPELLGTGSEAVYADTTAHIFEETESPSPTPTPSPTPDPSKTPLSISATYTGPTIVPGATLNTGHFSVTSFYEGGKQYNVTDFTINPSVIKRVGTQKVTISHKVNGKTFEAKVEIECVSLDTINGLTVSFNSNGGESVSSLQNIIPFSRVEVPTPKRSGYWFRGWFSDRTLQTPFLSGDYVYSNLILYAKWEKKENSKKDTMTVTTSDGTYSVTACIDLTDQEYDHTISLAAVSVDRKSIRQVVNSIAETELYSGLTLAIDGINFSSRLPLPVNLTVPEQFDVSATHVYLTTNLTSVMAEMPVTVSGSSLNFQAYQDGTYILLNVPTEQQVEEQKDPHIEIKCNKYQIAVGRETKLSVALKDFDPEEKATKKVKWISKNPKRASVDEKGWVMGLKKGKVRIRCKVTTENDVYTKTIKMEILP